VPVAQHDAEDKGQVIAAPEYEHEEDIGDHASGTVPEEGQEPEDDE
jgi:hypothetical protein